jgi:hypothetical protein
VLLAPGEPPPGGIGVVLQPGRFLLEDGRPGVGQPVVAAQPSIDHFLPVRLEQPFIREPVQRAVQGAGAQRHACAGQLGHLTDDRVAVQRLRGQRGEDQERGLAKRIAHDQNISVIKVSWQRSHASPGTIGPGSPRRIRSALYRSGRLSPQSRGWP